MHFDRSAGVLLHISSLPGDFGIGDLGTPARRFVDFLQRAGQSVWQVLPLGPTVQGNSPYSCYSAFAGNPLFISIQQLVDCGLLTHQQLEQLSPGRSSQCNGAESNGVTDYRHASLVRQSALQMAFLSFLKTSACERFDDFESFCTRQKWWLDDFALFVALMKQLGNDNWSQWEQGLVRRKRDALGRWKKPLARAIEFEQFVQFVFYEQWSALREYARDRNVKLFGDMPIFVAHGSADVWANQRMFCLKPDGTSKVVAGVPPDYFSKTGQLWGNPLYDWNALKESGYRWWTRRFKSAFDQFDMLRIDHFRGFESYWQVPASAKTAVSGQWVQGPGTAPFDAARAELGDLAIVAEDLGVITDDVHALRERLEFPGMRVMQFGFDHEKDEYHRPDQYPEHCVAYTGTHDNSTVVAWHESRKQRAPSGPLLAEYLDRESADLDVNWKLIASVFRSKAKLAIVPLQDILGLSDEARMNRPGQSTGNWTWRYSSQHLTAAIADQLLALTTECGR